MRKKIVELIKTTAEANGGKPLGIRAFEKATGVRLADWFGKYWKAWGDAVAEAGYSPNSMNGRIADQALFEQLALLTRELGRVPVKGDLRLKRVSDSGFANDKVFERLGSKSERIERLREFCAQNSAWTDVLAFLPSPRLTQNDSDSNSPSQLPEGTVYMVRLGHHYKIGHTNSMGRREYELNLQLPERVKLIHTITTDDPEGIEAYWHRRFASKRTNGEWFRLEAVDIAAFKKRTFQ